ncbi:MAG: ParB N-terminal domain-containing protein, partial [Defluviitaleaceae bacterium]|nr:ParB N-terminal domain-containing protein [Defluviitaleaceae bacterium]
MPTMTLTTIPVEKLNPAKYNPRKDLKPGDPEYEKLLQSVSEFGYVEPIVWNQKTGNIVGGNQRFKVLKKLGFTEIDCVVIDMDEVREKALCIALNKISGEFDEPTLFEVMKELEQSGYSVSYTGFDVPELDKMYQQYMRSQGYIEEDDFDGEAEAGKITEPITRPGDIWLLGKHKLMCGDSTDIGAVARLMDGTKAQMVFTDCPYNVDYGGDDKHPSWKSRKILNDKMSTEQFYEFLLAAFKAMASVCAAGAAAYIFMSAQEWPSIMTAMTSAGF